MITAQYDWNILPEKTETSFIQLAKKEGIPPLLANLLYHRGIKTEEAIQTFVHPSLDDLHDPYLLYDMDKAVERIRIAIERNERILLYGDYDADGMTSAALLKETLEELGGEVHVYLPNRFTDGYGPNQSVYQYFIEQEQVSLILTVDNGVAGHEAIAYAQNCSVDVIVTDHHSLKDPLPDAYAIVHPEHPEGNYPFRHLAGCGVAFKLAWALLERIPVDVLDLVAIGTIADMVSLTDENRAMVRYGLSLLKQTERVGLQELMSIAGVELSSISEEEVGFQLAPRLNALGRLDDPAPAIDLLTGFDEEEARDIAQMIDEKNTERKALVQQIYEEASSMICPEKHVQVLAKEGWNPGVLGIVAGRLLEEWQQPVIVLAIEDGKAKGSARSVESVDIFQALSQHPDLFLAFGGHSGAAGMTLETEKLDELSTVLENFIVDKGLDCSSKPSLTLDGELDLEDLTVEILKSFDKLAPYGMENPKPIFYLKNVQIESARTMGQNNTHLKFRIRKGEVSVDVIAFGKGNLVLEFSQVKQLDLAVTLSLNQWNGKTSLQLMLVDARVDGIQLYNIRGKNQPLPQGIPVWKVGEPLVHHTALVLEALPEELSSLPDFFKDNQLRALYFKNQIATPYYLEGYGSREQYARLYKTIHQFKEFDVRYKLKELASYLKIKELLLIKMIHIFQELEFVTITDGVMTINPHAQKRDINESHIYQELKNTVIHQELLALGTVQEIYDWLCGGEFPI